MDQRSYSLRKDTVSTNHLSRKKPEFHTTLSSYIWKLKDKKIDYEIKWSIKARGQVFSSGG